MVTPVILTFNEDRNLESTLSALAWASRIVVLDSGSTDRTEQIARSFENVAWFVRKFDNHAVQWQHAIRETGIMTEYVLALDADMRPSDGFQIELERFLCSSEFAGASIPFEYRVLGRPLMASIYPAQIRLFRKDTVQIEQPGHTQVFNIPGRLYRFRVPLIHEDCKQISRWLSNQMDYATLEAARIRTLRTTTIKDRLRLAGISPFIWGVCAYVRAGGPFNPRAARAYASERMVFESLLARLLAE